MANTHAIQTVKLYLPKCTRTYGSAPCTAAIGVTGNTKCFNSAFTCQDIANYDDSSRTNLLTLTFSTNSMLLPVLNEQLLPCIMGINFNPAEIKPGINLGKRERVSITLSDFKYGDDQTDPYLDTRYILGGAFERGTFWGKMFARYPNMQGFRLDVINSLINQDTNEIEESVTYHYFVDKVDMSNNDTVTIYGIDALSFLDNKQAQAPTVSSGVLFADITNSATSATLQPAGIGNAEYPASGTIAIDKEIMDFTRTNDILTLSNRGKYNTDAKEHKAGDTVQICLIYSAETFDTILEDLLTNYTDTPSTYIDTTTWNAEATIYPYEFTRVIAKPTAVSKLVDDLVQDGFLDVHTDIVNQKIVARFLTNFVPSFDVDENSVDFTNVEYDSDEVYNQLRTSFAPINPLDSFTDLSNYQVTQVYIDDDQRNALVGGSLIKNKFSPWLNTSGITLIGQIGRSFISTYHRPRETTTFRVPYDVAPKLGDVGTVSHRFFQDSIGNIEPKTSIVTKVRPDFPFHIITTKRYEVEQLLEVDGDEVIVWFYSQNSMLDVNLYDAFIAQQGEGYIDRDLTIRFKAASAGLYFGGYTNEPSASLPITSLKYACRAGDWTSDAGYNAHTVTLIVDGIPIYGRGGRGGADFDNNGIRGQNGLHTTVPITLHNSDVGGGGGGGGGWSVPQVYNGVEYRGGTGAGSPGLYYLSDNNSTLYLGGTGEHPDTGDGGDLGQPGTANTSGQAQGGAAGLAVYGYNLVTLTGTSTVYGSTLNHP